MKSLNKEHKKDLEKSFKEVFEFEDAADQVEVDAKLIMAKFLAEIQKVADEKGLKRKDLAEKIGTSPSYLTQLFRGNKLMNFSTLAKLQRALDISFRISLEEEEVELEELADFKL